VFLTAQRCKGNPPPNWKAIAELGGAAAIYMPGGHEADLSHQLIEAGLPPETRCIVVANATRPGEQVIETTLAELPDVPKLPAPALLLIGVVPAAAERRESFSRNTGKLASDH
jgi:siroheme synthase